MRFAIFALAVLAGGGAAEAGQIELLSGSPRHFEIAARCWTGSNCQQEASDFAQGYCRSQFEVPRRALYVRTGLVERSSFSERVIFVYRCSQRSIICEAGNC
jgi:hypothetical protein